MRRAGVSRPSTPADGSPVARRSRTRAPDRRCAGTPAPSDRRPPRAGGSGESRSCLEQALREHDLDDIGDRFLAGPVALELDGERDPGDRLRTRLDDALDARAMGLLARAADRVDDGVDVIALPQRIEGG